MMQINVTKNAKRNMIIGFVNKIILLFLPFCLKTIINYYLGSEYLGLNSLFSSILTVLSLSELGFSSALVYNMYRPIAENDSKKICALLAVYRKAYKAIGVVILTFGLCVTPFLEKFVNGSYPENINVYLLFIVQLLNIVLSYFMFGYKQSLLAAYQREDIKSVINFITQFLLNISQIICIVLTRNYYFFVICMPIFTVINNLWIGYVTKKMFPEYEPNGKLDTATLSSIKRLVAGTFIQKACVVTRNSLDSICISAFLGLTMTAIYNNYFTLIGAITSLLAIISTSLTGGIGNHVAVKSIEDNFGELKKIDYLYMMISGWCTACLLCLYQPFMRIWMGSTLLLDMKAVVLLCLYFYLLKIGDMRTMYSTANGLWWKMKYRSILETIGNLGLNIILGRFFGVCGIIVATIISLTLCNIIWASEIVFKSYFGRQYLKQYYKYHVCFILKTVIVCVITYVLVQLVAIDNKILSFVLQGIVTFIVSAGLIYVLNCRSQEFKNAFSMIQRK